MYKQATRQNILFPYKNGRITVQALWQLNSTELSTIYAQLKRDLEQITSFTLTNTPSSEKTRLELAISIVKDVYDTIAAEAEAKFQEALKQYQRNAKRQELLAARQALQQQAYEKMTLDEIDALLKELE
ncbi:MAG: hypothetical protein E6Q36_08875 [Chryseobacterium sp.]|nr:MAG: hypothetical protein E6Q36_08875 [Chryseobacterium sp.]